MTDQTAAIEVWARMLCAADVHVYGADHPTWQQTGSKIRDDYRKAAAWLLPRLTVAAAPAGPTPATDRAAVLREAIDVAREEGHRLEEAAGIEAARGARCVAYLLRKLLVKAQPDTEAADVPRCSHRPDHCWGCPGGCTSCRCHTDTTEAQQSCSRCGHSTDWHDPFEGCVGPNGIGGLGSEDCDCPKYTREAQQDPTQDGEAVAASDQTGLVAGLRAAASEIDGIDFHPKALVRSLDIAAGLSRRLRRMADELQPGSAQDSEPKVCGAREPEPRSGTRPCVLPAGHGGTKHQDKWTNQWPIAAVARSGQPETDEELVHVGWWCWRGDNHGHLATMACRSDNVPIHVPAEWADEMRAVLQRIEDGDEPETDAP